MTVEKLHRIMWRLRKNCPDKQTPSYHELRKAIILECGISTNTFHANKKALSLLGWITPYTKNRFKITNKDISDN